MKEFENTYGDCVGIENWKVPQTIGIGSPRYGIFFKRQNIFFLSAIKKATETNRNRGFFPEKILGGEFTKGFKGIRMIRHEKKMTEHAAIFGDFM